MQTRLLPGTDIALSVVGMGCWTIGGTWWGPDQDDQRAVRAIHAALDAGINWFDTAPLYGDGRADQLVGLALRDRPEALIATKVGVRVGDGHPTSDLSAAHVVADCEASLRRLGRDRIDLLQVHWPCEHDTPLDETLAALVALRERGDIRAFGLCNYDASTLAAAREQSPVVSLQTPLSLLRREYEGALLEEVLTVRGAVGQVGVLAYEALCRGLLTGRFRSLPTFEESDQRSWDPRFSGYRFAHARALVDDLEKVAGRVGCTVPALALGWVLGRPGVTAVIAGVRTPIQARDNATAAALVGRKKLWSVVDRVAALHGGT